MNRITEAHLQAIVDRINRETGNPAAPWVPGSGGRMRSVPGVYTLDNAYGGWSLSQIVNESGGERDVLGSGKVPKAQLASLMHAYLAGLNAKRGVV